MSMFDSFKTPTRSSSVGARPDSSPIQSVLRSGSGEAEVADIEHVHQHPTLDIRVIGTDASAAAFFKSLQIDSEYYKVERFGGTGGTSVRWLHCVLAGCVLLF
jgi:hypothetical protein